MRVVVLRTSSNSCDPIFRPLGKLGCELKEIIYDILNPSHEEYVAKRASYEILPKIVSDCNPDWVLMLGCHEGDNALVPPVEVLAEINKHYKLVHLCCDGGDSAWWPQLEKYNQHNAVALHVNIDGVRKGPFYSESHTFTGLCPIDPSTYPDPPKPWDERLINLGFRGGWGGVHPRTPIIQSMLDAGILNCRLRSGDDYGEYVDFMSSCKCVLNHAANGTGDGMHVKARVIETALAGALLIENVNSPTSDWFDPGTQFIRYRDLDDVQSILKWIDKHPEIVQAMIIDMRRQVLTRHTPKVFWSNVMERAGIR